MLDLVEPAVALRWLASAGDDREADAGGEFSRDRAGKERGFRIDARVRWERAPREATPRPGRRQPRQSDAVVAKVRPVARTTAISAA